MTRRFICLDAQVFKEMSLFGLHAFTNCSPAQQELDFCFVRKNSVVLHPSPMTAWHHTAKMQGIAISHSSHRWESSCLERSEWRSRQRGGPITLRSLDRSQALKYLFGRTDNRQLVNRGF